MGIEQLVHSGCRNGNGQVTPLRRLKGTPTALQLGVKLPATASQSCWAQLQPFEIELPPDKVAVYLKEISAQATVRQAWSAMQQRDMPWEERYTKRARIETGVGVAPTLTAPVNLALDVLPDAPSRPIRVGEALRFQVLRDGQPLPYFAVELRSDVSGVGIWRRTDALGRVAFIAPLAGRWVLRGTELRLSEALPDLWESRFVTLAFEVQPAAPLKTARTLLRQ